MEGAKRLDNLYDDEDQMRKEEINKIAGPNEFTEFYSRLRQIKEFHRIRPEDVAKPLSFEFEQMNIMVRQNEDLPSKFCTKNIYIFAFLSGTVMHQQALNNKSSKFVGRLSNKDLQASDFPW